MWTELFNRLALRDWLIANAQPSWFGAFAMIEHDKSCDVLIVDAYGPSDTARDLALEGIALTGKSGVVWAAVDVVDGRIRAEAVAGRVV